MTPSTPPDLPTPEPDPGKPSPNTPVEGRVVERAQISKEVKLPEVAPRQKRVPMHQFPRTPTKTKNPRKVRGGVKVSSTENASSSWAGQRFLRLVELAATGSAQAEGLEYAKLGQIRKVEIGAGRVSALVQGRLPKAYRTNLSLPAFTREQWDRIITAMIDQALYSAKLLAGEVPPSIEDVFAPLGLRLFPPEAPEGTQSEVVPTCDCDEPKTDASPWCKHACAVAYAVADQLADDPWIIFRLRGMEKEELLERLRHHRSLSTAVGGSTPVYVPRIDAMEDVPVEDIRATASSFWEAPPAAVRTLQSLDLAAEAPDVTHPLLRRLGGSPFEDARFPMVGLLATCYDLMTRDVAPDEVEPEPTEAPTEAPPPADTASAAERRRRAMAPKKIGKAKARKPGAER